MTNEAAAFAVQMSHLEKATLGAISKGTACAVDCADLLTQLGLAVGPNAQDTYTLTAFGEDVLSHCVAPMMPQSSAAAETPTAEPGQSAQDSASAA